jgi:hypothetical protein
MAKHVEKSWMFAKESLDMYSEQDFSIKFWSGLFETYIGRQKDILLNW